MKDNDEVYLAEYDPEKPSTSKAIPVWPSKEAIKDLKSSSKKTKRKNAASEKKVKSADADNEKPMKPKQAKVLPSAIQADAKTIQTSFGYACMSLSKEMTAMLASEHSFEDIRFTPEVVARTAQIVQAVLESKWAPNLAAFSKHAKRAKITADDARLLFHKNHELLAKVDETFLGTVPIALARRPSPVQLQNVDARVGDDEDNKHDNKSPRKSSASADAHQMSCATSVQVGSDILSMARSIKLDKADVLTDQKDDQSSMSIKASVCSPSPKNNYDCAKELFEYNALSDAHDSFDEDEVLFDDRDDNVDDIILESGEDSYVKAKRLNETVTEEDQNNFLSENVAKTSLEERNEEFQIDCSYTAMKRLTKVPTATGNSVAAVNEEISYATTTNHHEMHDSDDSFYRDDDIDIIMEGKKEDEVEEILWESYRDDDNDDAKNQQNAQAPSRMFVSASLSQLPSNRPIPSGKNSFSQIHNKRPSNEPNSTPASKVGKDLGTMEVGQSKDDTLGKKQWNPFKPIQITPPSENVLEKRQLNSAKKSLALEKQPSYRSDDSLFDDDDVLF